MFYKFNQGEKLLKAKIGSQIPYFEFLDGIKGKSVYDLRNRWHFVIYNSNNIDLSEYEDQLEKAGVKVIDHIQILTKDFINNIDVENKDEFLILVDRYGAIQLIAEGENIPNFKEIMETIQFIEDEGCCAL